MKIGIDARLINETGVGRYIRNLLDGLALIDHKNEYYIYLLDHAYDEFVSPNERFHKRHANVRWHTIREQFVMPQVFGKDSLDLVHIPYYSIPIFYTGNMIVTIHDLTILHVHTGRASTLPWPLYYLKQIGYRIMMRIGLRRASHIIAVSKTTKKEIIDHFHIDPGKITVTYEGIDRNITESRGPVGKLRAGKEQVHQGTSKPDNKQETINEKQEIVGDYFLYVGNAYPHKNVELMIQAFDAYKAKNPNDMVSLVLVGSDDFFYKRLQTIASELASSHSIRFFGPSDDRTLAILYKTANALIFPSQMEGFGLPALEALYFRTPLIVSDILVFREILGTIPYYVNVNDKEALIHGMAAMRLLTKSQFYKDKEQNVKKILEQYNWNTMAKETIRLYE